ncbi:MAG: tRNA (adenosine(37)-N6)-threonylcarbamoyltransferase complex transferase subunit TsaD [Salinispira sp.]
MLILGIETSCDECSCALVRDGRTIISHIVATQMRFHRPYKGVVPEIAARKHIEMILPVFEHCMRDAEEQGITLSEIDGIGVTSCPGLSGSLAVGLGFAKGLALTLQRPFIGINHILAHFYAPHMEFDIPYPHLGLLVSGGHTIISKIMDYDDLEILGTTIDDACGEAFDKVARHFDLEYPGGKIIDDLAKKGNDTAFNFPFANLSKRGKNYAVSYSGLKNAVINQRDRFWDGKSTQSVENICASFQRVAIDSVLRKLDQAVNDTGLKTVVVGGGVAANSYLRMALGSRLGDHRESRPESRPEFRRGYRAYFPSLKLCTDNGAMVAGLAYHYLKNDKTSTMDHGVSARVNAFRFQ